ncbi:MAG: SOS response-associated peptidase [Salinirussus sp.]
MCGRFSLFRPPDVVEERFDAEFAYPYERRYNAAPGQQLPVITDERPTTIQAAEWGLIPLWADTRDDAPTPINARGETAHEKPTFRQSFSGASYDDTSTGEAAGRCLVLADGFYEWGTTSEGKQPFRLTRPDDQPFAMAGLWTRWQPSSDQTGLNEFVDGGSGGDPDPILTFAIITTDANDVVAEIHDRMPVILAPEQEERWLTAEPDDARTFLVPAPDDALSMYPVSRSVNDPSNDSPDVVERVDLPG